MTPEALQELDNMVIDETELVSSILRESFYEFVLEMWDTVVTAKFKNNWHIKYLCNELQIIAERVFREEECKYNLIINISPGTTKSTIVSILFPAWIWTRKPDAGIIGSSGGFTLAVKMNRLTRVCVTSDKYRSYFPEIYVSQNFKPIGCWPYHKPVTQSTNWFQFVYSTWLIPVSDNTFPIGLVNGFTLSSHRNGREFHN